jgi:hypothetical protein
MEESLPTPIYEYAGFRYTIEQRKGDDWLKAYPLPGQHPAANKDKHRRAAVEMFKQENGVK